MVGKIVLFQYILCKSLWIQTSNPQIAFLAVTNSLFISKKFNFHPNSFPLKPLTVWFYWQFGTNIRRNVHLFKKNRYFHRFPLHRMNKGKQNCFPVSGLKLLDFIHHSFILITPVDEGFLKTWQPWYFLILFFV